MQPGATAVTVPRAGYHTIVSVFKVFLPEAAKICTRFFFCGEKKLEVSRGLRVQLYTVHGLKTLRLDFSILLPL